MARKLSAQRLFFQVGHKVQLKPNTSFPSLSSPFAQASATIIHIERCPNPNFFDNPHNWYDGPHWVNFWIKFDEFLGLDEHIRKMEIPYKYQELRPLLPRMTEQQLLAYCEQHLRSEQNSDCKHAYFQVIHYLNRESVSYPLNSALFLPDGHCIDLINLFLSWTAWMQQKAQEDREKGLTKGLANAYERQSQVYEEIYQRLLPETYFISPIA